MVKECLRKAEFNYVYLNVFCRLLIIETFLSFQNRVGAGKKRQPQRPPTERKRGPKPKFKGGGGYGMVRTHCMRLHYKLYYIFSHIVKNICQQMFYCIITKHLSLSIIR